MMTSQYWHRYHGYRKNAKSRLRSYKYRIDLEKLISAHLSFRTFLNRKTERISRGQSYATFYAAPQGQIAVQVPYPNAQFDDQLPPPPPPSKKKEMFQLLVYIIWKQVYSQSINTYTYLTYLRKYCNVFGGHSWSDNRSQKRPP